MRGDWTRSNAVDQRCATSEELPICTKPSIHITQRNQDTVGITTTPSAINNMKMFRLKINMYFLELEKHCPPPNYWGIVPQH